MASIFDISGHELPKPEPEPQSVVKRSKFRENLTASEINAGKAKLMSMVERAFQTLNAAMESSDWPTAVKAAQIILDRTGFGPKTTMDVNHTTVDLSNMSREELAARASKIASMLAAARDAEVVETKPVSVN